MATKAQDEKARMLREARARTQSAASNGNGNATGLATSDDTRDEEVIGAIESLQSAQGGALEPQASRTRLVAARPRSAPPSASGGDVDERDTMDPSAHLAEDLPSDDAGTFDPLRARANAHMKAAGAQEVLARQKTAAPSMRAERAKAARVRAGARQRPVR